MNPLIPYERNSSASRISSRSSTSSLPRRTTLMGGTAQQDAGPSVRSRSRRTRWMIGGREMFCIRTVDPCTIALSPPMASRTAVQSTRLSPAAGSGNDPQISSPTTLLDFSEAPPVQPFLHCMDVLATSKTTSKRTIRVRPRPVTQSVGLGVWSSDSTEVIWHSHGHVR